MINIYLSRDNWYRLCEAQRMRPDSDYLMIGGLKFIPEIKILYAINVNDEQLKVEQWPEGHVVWANGKIIWKSWET